MQLDGGDFGDQNSKFIGKKRDDKKITLGGILDQGLKTEAQAVKTEQVKKKKDKVVITEKEDWNLVAQNRPDLYTPNKLPFIQE